LSQCAIERFAVPPGVCLPRFTVEGILMPKPTYKELAQRLKELEEAVSKRNNTEQNLVQREDFLSAYFDRMPLLTYHVSLDGVIVDCNLTAVRTLGYRSKAELIGRPLISTIYARPFQEKASRLLERWKAEGSLRNEEMEVVTKHGDLKTVLLNADTIFDGEGSPVYSLSTQLDITDRVMAKGELGETQRLNERRLEALLQLNEMRYGDPDELAGFALERSAELTQSDIGFINFLSEDRKFVTRAVYTQNTRRECGLPINTSAFEISDCGLWSEAYRQRQPIVVNDYDAGHAGKVGYPEGHPRISRFMSIPIFENARVVAVAALGNKEKTYNSLDLRQFRLFMEGFWEIMQRRRAEDWLKLNEEKFRTLYENASDGIFLLDDGGIIRGANPRMTDMLGYEEKELLGRNAREMIHPDELNEIPFKLPDLLTGKTLRAERRVRKKDGSDLVLDISARRIRAGLIQGICRDVTQQRKMENHLADKSEQLSRQANHLEEVNTALKVLVDHRDREREEFSRQIVANVRKLVLPYLEKLDRVLERPENKTCLEIAKSNLMELVRPLAAVAPLTRLSPAELQVADMVKYGKTSKEIATVLHLSEETVRFHRKNIRKKLEINKQSVNLRSYLMSLSEK